MHQDTDLSSCVAPHLNQNFKISFVFARHCSDSFVIHGSHVFILSYERQKFVMDQTIIRWQLQRCKKVGACTDILLPKNKLKCLFKGEIPLTSTRVCGQRAWKGSDTFPALSSSGDVHDQKKWNMWHLKSSFSIRHTYMQECCIWMWGWSMRFLAIEKLYGSLCICLIY